MTNTDKRLFINDICFKKYGMIESHRECDYLYKWRRPNDSNYIISYDYYYDKIMIATTVIFTDNNKPLFCLHENIQFVEFESKLDELMSYYKKALVFRKIKDFQNDFEQEVQP